jgi:hypothetical protein
MKSTPGLEYEFWPSLSAIRHRRPYNGKGFRIREALVPGGA